MFPISPALGAPHPPWARWVLLDVDVPPAARKPRLLGAGPAARLRPSAGSRLGVAQGVAARRFYNLLGYDAPAVPHAAGRGQHGLAGLWGLPSLGGGGGGAVRRAEQSHTGAHAIATTREAFVMRTPGTEQHPVNLALWTADRQPPLVPPPHAACPGPRLRLQEALGLDTPPGLGTRPTARSAHTARSPPGRHLGAAHLVPL